MARGKGKPKPRLAKYMVDRDWFVVIKSTQDPKEHNRVIEVICHCLSWQDNMVPKYSCFIPRIKHNV